MMDRSVRIRFYADLAAARHGCTRADVLSRSRKPTHVEARTEVMRRLHAAGWNYSLIGKRLDRHPSTVLHAMGKLSR